MTNSIIAANETKFISISTFVLMFAPAHAQQVNILSYNVHNCIGMDKEYNYRRIANVISQTSPDIVALQELDSVTVRNKGIHALGELEKLTGMHGTYAAAIPFQGGSYGIGILSREIPIKYKSFQCPDGKKNVPSLLQNLKIMYFVPHTSPSLQKTSSLPYH